MKAVVYMHRFLDARMFTPTSLQEAFEVWLYVWKYAPTYIFLKELLLYLLLLLLIVLLR